MKRIKSESLGQLWDVIKKKKNLRIQLQILTLCQKVRDVRLVDDLQLATTDDVDLPYM